MIIFDSSLFTSVKPFGYVFFWGGLIAVLYPPYIQLAKWDRITKWVERCFKLRIEDDLTDSDAPKKKNQSGNETPATPENNKKTDKAMPSTDSKPPGKPPAEKVPEKAQSEAKTARSDPKQYLKKTPVLSKIPFKWAFNPSQDNQPLDKASEAKDGKPAAVATEVGTDCSSFYYANTPDVREQLYNNIWRHFRTDYRRMNPITKHDGVVEFWQMVESRAGSFSSH